MKKTPSKEFIVGAIFLVFLGVMFYNTKDFDWKLIYDFPVEEYKCGLRAGDEVVLKNDFIIKDDKGYPTGKVYHKGEIWRVLPGAEEETSVVWLMTANGDRHTWDDDESIYEWFDKIYNKMNTREKP